MYYLQFAGGQNTLKSPKFDLSLNDGSSEHSWSQLCCDKIKIFPWPSFLVGAQSNVIFSSTATNKMHCAKILLQSWNMASILLRPLMARVVGGLTKKVARNTALGASPSDLKMPGLLPSGIFLSCCGVHSNNEPDQVTLRSRSLDYSLQICTVHPIVSASWCFWIQLK